MDSRLEEKKCEMNKLHEDRDRFWARTDAKSCSVTDLIDRFLKSTDSTMPEDQVLSFFAQDCHSHLGWSGACQVYEYIIANEPDPHARHGTYHSWTFFGTAVMKDAENLSLDERVRVAADVEAVFERAAQDLGYYWENTLGYFYYDHPLKAEQPQPYLLKSKEWFERAIESEDFNECDHHDLQTLGHVFFELGDFKTALHWYKKFAAVENQCVNGCVLDRALAEKRLVECQQRMTEQDR
jgi:hypothetical protein